MIESVKTLSGIAKAATASVSGSGSVLSDPSRFKQMLGDALQEKMAIDNSRAQGIVEELTPEMAGQFFAQIIPEDEFNPKIERLDKQGVPLGGTRPESNGNVSDWTLAQSPAGGATKAVGQDPNQQAVMAPLNRPLGVGTLDSAVPGARPPRVEVTPFQFFLDKAVDFFLKVSDLERKSDMIMVDYTNGKASLEEVMVEKAKVSVALSFSVTLVNQVTQSFKEIQGMQV